MKAMKLVILALFFIFFILCLGAQDMDWQWALTGGGTSSDSGRGIVVDNTGNSYVTGHFIGEANFGTTHLNSYGSYDIYLAKANANGNWAWAIKAGGTSYDIGFDVSMGTDGFVYVTGYFNGTATFGTHSITASGSGYEIFVAKADSLGSWIWVRKAGSTGHDEGWAITTDSNNNSYITGYSTGTPFFGTHSYSGSGGYEIFVAKINSNGTWQWAKKAGSSGNDIGCGITLDSDNNIIACGYINRTATFGDQQIDSAGSNDIFIAKMDTLGHWLWANRAGGTAIDFAYDVVCNSYNDIYATGYFRESSSFGTTNLVSSGAEDAFIAKLDSSGTWQWTVKAGGTSSDIGYGIELDASDSLFVNGQFSGSADFGGIAKTSIWTTDIFVAKLSSDATFHEVYSAGPGSANDICFSQNGAFYVTGTMSGTGTFGTHNPQSAGSVDAFIAKLGYDPHLMDIPNPATLLNPSDAAINIPQDVRLEWNAASDGGVPTGYFLSVGLDYPPTSLLSGYDVGDSLSYTLSSLAPNTSYYWQVVPYNSMGSAVGCPIWSFTTSSIDPSFIMDTGFVDYGACYVDSLYVHKLALVNEGTGDGIVTNITMSGSSFFDFDIPGRYSNRENGRPAFPIQVPAGDTLGMIVIYRPLAEGSHTAELIINTDQPSTMYVTLMGTAELFTAPSINVTPNPVLHTSLSDTNTFRSIQIQNSGTGILDYSVVADSLPSWLSVDLSSGSVNPGQFASMVLFFNTQGMYPHSLRPHRDEEYVGNLILNTNDPLSPQYYVTVRLTLISQAVDVDFEGEPISGTVPLTVQFTDQSSVNESVTSATIVGRAWDFNGDGIVDSYLTNPSYIYSQPGVYDVKLTVTTNTGGVYHRGRNSYITVNNNSPIINNPLPVIDDMYEDLEWGPQNLELIFSDPDVHPLYYSAQNSSHIQVVFQPGVFKLRSDADWNGTESISITATDPYGASVTQNIIVTIIPVNDHPVITMPETLYCIRNAPFAIDFAQNIHDPDNPHSEISIHIVQIEGDNHIIAQYAQDVLGSLSATFIITPDWFGTESFMLHVNDHMGRIISFQEFDITVLEHFTAQLEIVSDITIQFAGQTVQFQDQTLGNPNVWSWQFEDGTVFSTSQNPSFTFMNAGNYTITNTVGNTIANEYATSNPQVLSFSGTAVIEGEVPLDWTIGGSPYNLVDGVEIALDNTISIDPMVEVNILNDAPLVVNGTLVASEVTFRAHNPGSQWGGLVLNESTDQTQLSALTILDAITPLRITGGSPSVSGITVANSDSTIFMDNTALVLSGSTSAIITGMQIQNYRNGILIENHFPSRNSTPTLSNIRIRNSSIDNRTTEEKVAITLSGYVDAQISDVVISDYSKAIEIGNDTTLSSTPTLTNIRIQNSSSGSRNGETKGIVISGNCIPDISDVLIEDTDKGLLIDAGYNQSNTPTISNIRIRNSSSGSRSISTGVSISGSSNCVLDDLEIENLSFGVVLENNTLQNATPTLSNIRIRNSSSGSRSAAVGIQSTGKVILSIDGGEIENCDTGIKYLGQNLSYNSGTPTISNIRIRNSSIGSRTESIGIELINIPKIVAENDSIGGCDTAIKVESDSQNQFSTPTLTNIRIKNSTSTSRNQNTGIHLGNHVGGSLSNCLIEGAEVGIFKTELNNTVLDSNMIKNCTIGIRSAGNLNSIPVRTQELILESSYQLLYPQFDFVAFEMLLAGPHNILCNTISGYPKGLRAIGSNVTFSNNIVWKDTPLPLPIESSNSLVVCTYNDIAYAMGTYPGIGNINANPLFNDPLSEDYTLHYNSPCIDAGLPLLLDEDGTASDMGAHPYLHRASFASSARFVIVGTEVNFSNTSMGHDHPISTIAWDVGADNIVESNGRDFSYTFNNAGIYDIRLIMSSGDLVDTTTSQSYIIVQNQALQAPQNPALIRQNGSILMSWDQVTQNSFGQPLTSPVTYYLVYGSDTINGNYEYLTHVQNQTSVTILDSGQNRQRFFFVIGFDGDERQLQSFIEANAHFGDRRRE